MNRIPKIDHLGIAVECVERSRKLYEDIFGLTFIETKVIPEQGVKVGVLKAQNLTIELLEPLTDTSSVGKFLKHRGPGIHHIAFEVHDLYLWTEYSKKFGISVVNNKISDGIGQTKVAFLHPQTTEYVLIELCQRGKDNEKNTEDE